MTGSVSKTCERKLRKSWKVSKVLYFEQICHDAAYQPKKMWREVNKALGHGHNGGISIIRSDGVLSCATDIVEEFNRYFSSFMGTRSRQGGHTWGVTYGNGGVGGKLCIQQD